MLIAVVLWGVQFPVAKDAFRAVDPFHVTAIRYTIGAALLVPLLLWREGATAFSYYGRMPAAAMIGVIGMCGSPMLIFLGIAMSRPEHAAIIVALEPSMTALADWAARGRKPAGFTLACVAVAFAGVVVVVTKGDLARLFSGAEVAGDLVTLAGALCWVIYTMGAENFPGWSALRFTTLTLIPGAIGCIVVTALVVAAGGAVVPDRAALGAVFWQLAYLTLGGIVVSMVAWNAGNQRIGAVNSILLINLMPVVTFAVRFAEGARFAPVEIGGAALVLAALVANNIYLRRAAAHPRSRS